MTVQDKDKIQEDNKVTFAETALTLAGKSVEEAKRTGAVDRADEQVEAGFAAQYKTVNSPIHKAVWDKKVSLDLFSSGTINPEAPCVPAMKACLEAAARHRDANTLYDENGKLSAAFRKDLAANGYFGMLIEKQYGGQGASVQHFMTFLGQMATIDPTTSGLASVHGCIGAVDPVRTYGNDEQKQRFLPRLASGQAQSGFALTEPNAGSDLTALRTVAVDNGDHYLLSGEKLFITNALPGHTVGVVCLIDGKPSALVVDLPAQENDQFQVVPYHIWALRRINNNGLRFNKLPVPKANRLVPKIGDGLTVAYHGLNLGRLALCATAAGSMRIMLSNMLPWAAFRETYGAAIDTRELVKRRIARTAALITGADALYTWGSYLLDNGYRGELECIIAKIFGSEAQKEVAIEYFMKTHGGRSFLGGHLFGDNVHDFLAPCIFEGEGEMLGMAFFKALAKEHGQRYFEPVGLALQKHKIKAFNPMNPAHALALFPELTNYAGWRVGAELATPDKPDLSSVNAKLRGHVEFALEMLCKLPLELSGAMVKHQLKLADRQCRIADMSQRVQDTITMIVTSLYASRQGNEVTIASADILCEDLKRKIEGGCASDTYFRKCNKLADMIIEGGMATINGIHQFPILFPYEKK